MKIDNKELDRIIFDKNAHMSLGVKSPALWGEFGNQIYPLIYFKKPKWITNEDFRKMIENIKILMLKEIQ